MAFIPTAQVIKCACDGLYNGLPVTNIFHVDVGTTPTHTLVEGVAAAFNTWMDTFLYTILNQGWSPVQAQATDVSVESGYQSTASSFTHTAGGVTGAGCPNNVAVCVSWYTDKTGRSYRGRTYLPAITLSKMSGDNITTAFQSDCKAVADGLLDDIGDLGWELVIVSFRHAGVWRTAGVATPIVRSAVNGRVDTQRRRLP